MAYPGHLPTLRTTGRDLLPGYVGDTALAELTAIAAGLADRPGAVPGCLYFLDRHPDGQVRPARIERVSDALPSASARGLLDRMAADAAEVLGGPVVLFKDKLNIRYPGSPGYAPHQDAARWLAHAEAFLSFGVFLSESSPERGGFRFADTMPGGGVQATPTGDFDPVLFATLPQSDVVARAGDVLAIDGAAPHRTTDNRSPDRVLHLLVTFARSDDPGLRDAYYAAQSAAFAQVRDGNLFTFDRR